MLCHILGVILQNDSFTSLFDKLRIGIRSFGIIRQLYNNIFAVNITWKARYSFFLKYQFIFHWNKSIRGDINSIQMKSALLVHFSIISSNYIILSRIANYSRSIAEILPGEVPSRRKLQEPLLKLQSMDLSEQLGNCRDHHP